MEKNGFTLVELVVTIALIGIIAAISFVSINGLVKEDKINKCNSLINNIKSASMEYVSDNRYDSSFVDNVINSSMLIDTKTLINGNYLDGEINMYKNNTKYSNFSVSILLDEHLRYKDAIVKTQSDVLIECDNGWEIK